ncbi:MAG TPA: hypothetical protein DCQ36_01855, partial [Actinobacteria bacterium]|nr:hypothetical protein [Actinomycetota bacterium]
MKTNITCTRCGTVTTWTPYCPGCGAYLEFAGDPPWVPEPHIPDDDAEGAGFEAGPSADAAAEEKSTGEKAAESTAPGGAAVGDASTPAVPAAATASGAEAAAGATTGDAAGSTTAPAEQEKPAAPEQAAKPSPPARPHRRFGGDAPWWRFWDKPEQPTAPVEASASAPEETPGPHESDASENTPFTYVVVAPEVPSTVSAESPARQEETQKRTIPIGRPDDLGVPGGIPCPNCRFRNYVDASYCARCGYPLRSAVPEVWTPANVLAASEKPPRRTNWGFIVLLGLGVFILGVIFFAPPGEPVRSAIGSVIRSFAYWIDPDLGTPVTVANVDATSTGYGNPATSVVGDDARSFWASAPSKEWGAGTSLTFTFTEPATIDRMVIRPGIQNGQFAVRALATPENLTLVFVQLSTEPPEPSPSGTASGTASGT